jgi:hypothetical protein
VAAGAVPLPATEAVAGAGFALATAGVGVLPGLFGRRTLLALPVPAGVVFSTCVLTARAADPVRRIPVTESARAALVFMVHSRKLSSLVGGRCQAADGLSPGVLDLLQMRQHRLLGVPRMFRDVPEQPQPDLGVQALVAKDFADEPHQLALQYAAMR